MMSNKVKDSIRIIGDRVLIKPMESNKTSGGIIIPDNAKDDLPVATGIIIRIGPGTPLSLPDSTEVWTQGKKDEVEYMPLQVKSGNFVVYFRQAAIDVEIEGEMYVILPQSAILLYDEDYF